MLVAELMTRNPATVAPGDPLASAVQIMWDMDCGAVPVVDPGTGKLAGILTDRDVCIATWSRGLAPHALTVSEVMTRELVRCGPNDSVAHAAEVLRSRQIRRIPVVDSEDRLLGIVSLADIVRVTGDASARRSDRDISNSGIAFTLAGICRASTPASRRGAA